MFFSDWTPCPSPRFKARHELWRREVVTRMVEVEEAKGEVTVEIIEEMAEVRVVFLVTSVMMGW